MTYVRTLAAGVATAILILALGASAPGQNTAVPQRRSLARPQDRSQDLSRQEQQIRRTRFVTRRILRDRRASETAKQQATELDALLDKRQQLIDRLQERQRNFAAQHQAEIDELLELRRRLQELDGRLAAARKDVLDGSKDDVSALKEAATRAADLADALRTYYAQERRGHRGKPAAGAGK
jgi:DNA repair exonuclease SbcCD ATPase subunit